MSVSLNTYEPIEQIFAALPRATSDERRETIQSLNALLLRLTPLQLPLGIPSSPINIRAPQTNPFWATRNASQIQSGNSMGENTPLNPLNPIQHLEQLYHNPPGKLDERALFKDVLLQMIRNKVDEWQREGAEKTPSHQTSPRLK